MKKLILIAVGLLASALAHAAPYDLFITQVQPSGVGSFIRSVSPLSPAPNTSGVLMYDGITTLPKAGVIGTGLSWDGATLSATAAAQVNSDWTAVSGAAQILNKPSLFSGAWGDLSGVPSTFPPSPHTHAASDITSGTLATARLPALAISQTTGLQASLDAKFPAPTGSTAQYIRGDGSLATLPTAAAFDFGDPAARTLSMSTSYQAVNTAKAAIVYPSFACTNSTTVLAASECTVQVRMGASALTCSTGTVLYTIRLAVSLGLLITQASTNPAPIHLGIGRHMIFCPVAGTFTVTTIEQTAG